MATQFITRIALLSGILGFLIAVVDLSAKPTRKDDEPFVQTASGMTFPAHVGSFRRANITNYTTDGRNVGVSFNLVDPRNLIAVTAYVYPARRVYSFGSPQNVVNESHRILEGNEFAAVTKDILAAHPTAKVLSREYALLAAGGQRLPGHRAVFEYEDVFAGRRQRLVSEAVLFTVGKWYLKYRATGPKATAASASGSVKKLIYSLPLPNH